MSKEIGLALQATEKRLVNVLPHGVDIGRFKSTVMMAVQRNPYLEKCDVASLMKACQLAAADGLLVDGRDAALVPFKNEVQYIPMIGGVLKKLRQSGELESIGAHVVYENDHFEYYIDETGPKLRHEPSFGDRGNMMLAYAVARLKHGGVQIEVMTKEEINKVKSASKTSGSSSSPWNQWPGEMWKKTVLRRICKYLPASVELNRVFEHDNSGYQFHGEEQQEVTEVDITPAPKTNAQLLDELAADTEDK